MSGANQHICDSADDSAYEVNFLNRRLLLRAHKSVLLAKSLARGSWEPHLFEAFNRYLSPQASYVDPGAFIGTSVMYGALLAKHCYAVEPNPLSFRYLQQNLSVNRELDGKVTTFEGCIWSENGLHTLTAPVKPYGSQASLRTVSGAASWQVKALTFDEFVALYQIKDVNFIKMDIEGAESIVLPTMKDFLRAERPTVLVSLHSFNYAEPASEIHAVMDTLSHYPYLYRRDGAPLDVAAVLRGQGLQNHTSENADILATDIPWPGLR